MNPYTILNISPDASDQEVKKAYRTLAKKYHPDVSKDPNAEAKFKEIQKAYDQIVEMRKNHTDYNSYTSYTNEDFFNRNSTSDSRFSTVFQYLNSGRYQDALNLLELINERNALWFYLASIAQDKLNNLDLAKEYAKTAYQLEPTNPIYRGLYARLFSNGDTYDDRYSYFFSIFWKIIIFIIIQRIILALLGY